LHLFFKLRPSFAVEERAQRPLVGLDEIRRAGVEFRKQLRQLLRRLAHARILVLIGVAHAARIVDEDGDVGPGLALEQQP